MDRTVPGPCRPASLSAVLAAAWILAACTGAGEGDPGGAGGPDAADTPAESLPAGDDGPADDTAPEVPADASPDTPPDAFADTAPDAPDAPPDAPDASADLADSTPDAVADGAFPPCVPDCTGRPCGDDLCGGTCGACGDGQACDDLLGQCLDACDWTADRPSAWGPAGQPWDLACPATLAETRATCRDFTGDGQGDNGLRPYCNQVIATVAPVPEVPVPLVAVAEGAPDLQQATSFTLVVLPVAASPDPPLPAGDVLATTEGYDTGTCRPRYAFPGARILDGRLQAGPADLVLWLGVVPGGPPMPLRVVQARVEGAVQPGGGPAGYGLTGGLLSGVVTRQALDGLVAGMEATCEAAPGDARPDWCAYLPVLRSTLAGMMDLQQAGDGTFRPKPADGPGDAASLCFTFRLEPVRVAGFAP